MISEYNEICNSIHNVWHLGEDFSQEHRTFRMAKQIKTWWWNHETRTNSSEPDNHNRKIGGFHNGEVHAYIGRL